MGLAGPCYKKMCDPCGDFQVAHIPHMANGLMFRLHHDGRENSTEVTYFEPVPEVPGNKIYRAFTDQSGVRIDISTEEGSRKIKKWHIVLVDLSTY